MAAEREADRAAGMSGGVGGEFGGEQFGVAGWGSMPHDASALRTAERAWRAAVRSARITPSPWGWPGGVMVFTEASPVMGCLQAGHMRDRPPCSLSWRSRYRSPSQVWAPSLTTWRS